MQTNVNRPLSSQGTRLSCDFADDGTYVDIAKILSLNSDDGESETFDSTGLEDLAREESATGLDGQGSVSGEMFYIPRNTVHQQLMAAKGVEKNWKITFNDDSDPVTGEKTTRSFAGTLKTLPLNVAVGQGVKSNFNISLASGYTDVIGS